MIISYKDAHKLEAKIKNQEITDCDQFSNTQTKSDIRWTYKHNFISSNNNGGNDEAYDKFKLMVNNEFSQNINLPPSYASAVCTNSYTYQR